MLAALLRILFYMLLGCALVAWLVGAWYIMSYNTGRLRKEGGSLWRLTLRYSTNPRQNVDGEDRERRRRAFIALAAFLGFLLLAGLVMKGLQ